MAIATTPRRLIDVVFVCALAACAVIYARHDRIPALPDCAQLDGVPKVPAHASIAAVFARIEGPEDVTRWSMQTLETELLAQGFHRTSHGFERADATVELVLLEDDEATVEVVLNRELARRDIVYYNGHHFGGGLELRAAGHPIAILDTCYSTQFYASLSATAELIGNRERAITGSVYGFADLLASLLERNGASWSALLGPLNSSAIDRASRRDVYPEPEHYSYCGQVPADPP